MWKQYFDECCFKNEQEPVAIYDSYSNTKEGHQVMVIKKHGISFLEKQVLEPSKVKFDNSLFAQCLEAIGQSISEDIEFHFESLLHQSLKDFSHNMVQFTQQMAIKKPQLLNLVQSNLINSHDKILDAINHLDYILPTFNSPMTGYFSSSAFISVKNAIDTRYKLVRNLYFFLHFQFDPNTDPQQLRLVYDWLKLLYSYKWLFQNANVYSSSGISLPTTIVKFLSDFEDEGFQMNIGGPVSLRNMKKGSHSLERQLLNDNHHEILCKFINLSIKTANSYHTLAASHLLNGDFLKAKHYFSKAVDNLNDGSLDDYLNEHATQENIKTIIKYRIVIVLLWSKARKHDYVIDEAYLGLADAEDTESRSLFFSQIFHNAILSEEYTEAYLVIVSLDPGNERNTNLKRLIQVLCEKGQLETLIQFPYFGILGQVIEIILELARRSSVNDRPNYYEILYAFLIQRGDYTTAASTIYECATRLFKEHIAREMKPSVLSYPSLSQGSLLEILNFQMDCLILSINALSLSHSQWFVYRPPIRTSRYALDFEEAEEPMVLNISALKREELIVYSLVSLLSINSVQLGNMSDIAPDQMLYRLIENEHFDLAFTIACEFELNKSPIYAAITRILIQVENDRSSGIIPRDTKLTWDYLKFLLQKYEDVVPAYHHYAEVLEQILTTSTMTPPTWMIQQYEKSFYPTLQVTRGLKNHSLISKQINNAMMVEGV